MISAYIVIRKEKHIDDKYWVCLNLEDAMHIAKDVTTYWLNQWGHEPDSDVIDHETYEDQLYRCSLEDAFSVTVQPQQIREAGEHEPIPSKTSP